MSLISYLNMDLTQSSGSPSTPVTQALQALTDAKAKANAGNTKTSAQSSVSITVEAKRAAAAKADGAKSAGALVTDVRADLDAQYKAAGQKNAANLTTMSGRALSAIALNETGAFDRAEIAAAKLELRARDRQSALATLGSGPLTAASLTTYSRNILAARDMMSAEEQRLRETNPKLR